MVERENLEASREIWTALNAHDMDRWAKLLDEGFLWQTDTLGAPVSGREAARRTMQAYFTGFPDLRWTIEQEFASEEFVVTRWWATGHHRGEFWGISATDRPVQVHGCTIAQWRGRKQQQIWVYWDTGRLLEQLGVWRGQREAA